MQLKNKLKNKHYLLAATLIFMSVAVTAETFEVEIVKKKYIPQELIIKKGDTVRWVNKEKRQYHSVWFEQRKEDDGEYFWPGEIFERVFNEIGVFSYRCGPHPKMTAIIKVINAPLPIATD